MIIEILFALILATLFLAIHELGHYLILVYKKYSNICILIAFNKKWFGLPVGVACYGHKELDENNIKDVLKALDEALFMIWGAVATTTIFVFGLFIFIKLPLDTFIFFMSIIIIYNKCENSDMIRQFINPKLKTDMKYYILYAHNKIEYIESDSLTNGIFEIINLKKWLK